MSDSGFELFTHSVDAEREQRQPSANVSSSV